MQEVLYAGFFKRLKLILQTEAAECGLACVAMIANYHGYLCDLASLRRNFSVSMKGITLANLIYISSGVGLLTRPLRAELTQLEKLRLPCILHWNLNHFVVLERVTSKWVFIFDPAGGQKKLSRENLSRSFTGIVLECWPGGKFERADVRQRLAIGSLVGRISGILKASVQVFSLAFALELFSATSPFFLQLVVDDVIVSDDRDLLTTLVIGFGLSILIQRFIGFFRSWVVMTISANVNLQWRSNLFSHLLRLPTSYFEKRHLGDLVSRFGSVDVIQQTLTSAFVEGVIDGVMSAVTIVLMLVYSMKLSFIVIFSLTFYALGRFLWYRPLRNAKEEQIIHAANQQTQFFETLRGIKTIKLFSRESERRSTWMAKLVNQLNADLQTQKLTLLYQNFNGLLFGIENILVIWLGAKMVLEGQFTAGFLVAFVAYKTQFDTRVGALIDKIVDLKMLRLQAERLADITLQEPEITTGNLVDVSEMSITPNFRVENIYFRYAEHEPYVLDGVSFDVLAGESIAITGPSGGGKTTLLNIMMGLLKPSSGRILFGGFDLSQLGTEALRKAVGTVLQDDVLFSGSIADNISFFDAQIDWARVYECARLSAVDNEINSMPMGYNTLVGDMGSVLSGGQKQRVLLARALYKNPSVLFLDEATSHLDANRELEVNDSVKRSGTTRIIIAHRDETIKTADRVIVLRDGKVSQMADGHSVRSSDLTNVLP